MHVSIFLTGHGLPVCRSEKVKVLKNIVLEFRKIRAEQVRVCPI